MSQLASCFGFDQVAGVFESDARKRRDGHKARLSSGLPIRSTTLDNAMPDNIDEATIG